MVLITAMDLLSEEEVVRAPAPTPTVVSTGGGGAGAAGGAARRPGEPDRATQWPCPRCESTDTKFCYYNNYNHAQPRHFCKGCRRYWTRGGALRNVPVGGGTRKASPAGVRRKRPSHSHAAAAAPSSTQPAPVVPLSVSAPAPLPPLPPQQYELTFLPPSLSAMDPDRHLLDLGGNFSSLLTPSAPLLHNAPNFATSFVFGGAGAGLAHAHVPAMPQQAPVVSQALPEGFWAMGWPDLSI